MYRPAGDNLKRIIGTIPGTTPHLCGFPHAYHRSAEHYFDPELHIGAFADTDKGSCPFDRHCSIFGGQFLFRRLTPAYD
jgi:hypothetical protein